MNLFKNWPGLTWEALTACINPVLTMPWLLIAVAGFFCSGLWIIGRRLGMYVQPERPYLSPFIRVIGIAIKGLGILAAVMSGGWVVLVLLLLISHQIAGFLAGVGDMPSAWLVVWKYGYRHAMGFIYGLITGVLTSLPIIWRVIPSCERGRGLPDVQELVRNFRKYNAYDPLPYINIKQGCFIGLDEKSKPIYVQWRKLRETHMQVLGMTGSGKGVAMSLIAYQCVLAGECLVWFDPKYDRYSPRIIQAAARQAGRPFHIIDLNPSMGPQINPLMGANEFEIEELLVAAFDLRSKGTDGDYYRGKDEDAAGEAARLVVSSGADSIPEMFTVCSSVPSITGQENFWRNLKKLAGINAVNTKNGLSLTDAIADGAVIYIIGSSDNERTKMLQKLLLVRIMQIIKGRDRLSAHSPTCIVLDEFKHMLSPAAFNALGVVRDFDTHFLLAHQSIGDLGACAGIDPAEAHGAVLDNTSIKIVYKVGDGEHAERLSQLSGTRRTYVDNSSKHTDEKGAATGSWQEREVPHINKDLLTHLPMPSDRKNQASVGVLFGIGNAKLFHVGPVPISGDMPTPAIVDPLLKTSSSNEDLI